MVKRTSIVLATVAMCLALAAWAMAASPQEGPSVPAPLADAVLQGFGLTEGAFVTLDLPQAPVESISVPLELGGEDYVIRAERRSLRAPDFRMLVQDASGELREVAPPAPRTYRGSLEGHPGSRVGLSLTVGGGLAGYVQLDSEHAWYVQPASRVVPGADSRLHVVYVATDVIGDSRFRCGLENAGPDRSLEEGRRGGGPQPLTTTLKLTEIALDADVEFYQLNGSSEAATLADMEKIINGIEVIYERDVSISYEISLAVIRTAEPDPYSSTNPSTLLTQFQNHWNGQMGGVRRDVAHLFTGKGLAGSVIGIAKIATICNTANAYGLSESRYTTNLSLRISLTAHEVGHNWNAQHCDGDSDCNIMCSTNGGCSGVVTSFGSRSISAISAFRNSRSCLTTLPDPLSAPFFDDFPSTTIDGTKWIYNDGGAVLSGAFNEPSPPNSLNLDSKNSSQYGGDNEIRTNEILLAGLSNVTISFYTEHRGVASGESLYAEYLSQTGVWTLLQQFVSDGTNQDYFQFFHQKLSSSAIHDEARFRFRTDGNSTLDDWYIDNVSVAPSDVLVTVLPDNTQAPAGGDIFFDAFVTNLDGSNPNSGTAWVDAVRPDGSPLAAGGNPRYGPKGFNLNPAQMKSKLNIRLRVPGDATVGTGYRVIAIVGDSTTGFVENVSEFEFEVTP